MRFRTGLLFATFLVAAVSAYGSTIVIDNFSCPDSVTLDGPAGATAFNASFVSCPGSIGGEREDFIANFTEGGASGGSAGSVSTMNSNPPAGAITGTFGSGIIGFEGMVWGNGTGGTFIDLGLDLVGDSLLVQIQSDSGGTVFAYLSTTLIADECNCSLFSATFSGAPGYQDILIPLSGTPIVTGTAADLADVNNIDLGVSLNTPGSSFTIDAVDAVSTPEPSPLLMTCLLLAGAVFTRSFWRRFARQ